MEGNHSNGNPFAASGLFRAMSDVWTPFKASFEGFAGAGKSWTMYQMAIGIWEAEGKTGSVVLIDTEKSAKFAIPVFREAGLIEGKNFFVSQSRSLVDFNKILKLANETRAILLVDSVTHLYEEMCRAFSEQKKRPITYPQDAMILKPTWKEQFTNPFVNAQNCHIIFTGRAAWEYKMSINEQSGKKEFNAEGVKMRGDNETAFEPDLLVLMEREQEINKDGDVVPYRLATIMKFRNPILDGKQFRNPTWKDFEPAYRFVASGAIATPDNQPAESSMGPLFQRGNSEAYFLQRQRAERLVEEIKGIFDQWGLGGTGGTEKAVRANLYQIVFNNRTTIALAEMHPEELVSGKELIECLARYAAKNMDFIEKLFKEGEMEKLNSYLADAHKQYLEGMKKASVDMDDDIPDFAPADSPVTGGESTEVKEIIGSMVSDIRRVKNVTELNKIFKTFEPVLEKMSVDDVEQIKAAYDERRRAFTEGKKAKDEMSAGA